MSYSIIHIPSGHYLKDPSDETKVLKCTNYLASAILRMLRGEETPPTSMSIYINSLLTRDSVIDNYCITQNQK